MNNRQKQIGFSQRIRLEWLQQTANLVLAGNDKGAVNNSLQELLKDKVSVGGKAVRGNKEKAITILMKIWLNVPRGLDALCSDGLELLKNLPSKDQIAVHWGMAMAAYPFWATVAANTGRLLRLQGTAAAAHVQRRVREQYGERREQYGERETVSRAARRVIRSFVDWGVLSETSEKGIYDQGLTCSIDDPRLISWLIEASLHARSNGSAAIKDLLDSPSIFPFHLMRVSVEHLISMSPRLDLLRHGLDDDLVMLREESQAARKGGLQ
jgi:hypothetical protein